MRDKVNVLYYPGDVPDLSTLKKAILLFDELHFMDRPRYVFEWGCSSEAAERSPLRNLAGDFQAAGVPLYVHWTLTGHVNGVFRDEVETDVNDLQFLHRFQTGLRESAAFRRLQETPDDDGDPWLTHRDMTFLSRIDWTNLIRTPADASALLEEPLRYPLDYDDPEAATKMFVYCAAICSAKIHNGLSYGARNGLTPLADAPPYGELVTWQSARPQQGLLNGDSEIPITDLAYSILDEIVPRQAIDSMTLEEAIRYRHQSAHAREEFLEHLSVLQLKARVGTDGELAKSLRRLIATEVLPAAKAFRHKLRAINETFWTALTKGAVGALGAASGLEVFGALSWPNMIPLAGSVGAYIMKSGIDAVLALRAARRESSLTYCLSLH